MEVVGMPNGKNMKLIKFRDEYPVSLGRSEECDVRINDSSISYKHALLSFELSIQRFVLKDDYSKFGTLLLIQRPYKLSAEHETTVQVGQTILNLKLEKVREKDNTFARKFCDRLSTCFS